MNRSGDWLAQAERDLAQAESSRRQGHHEWACFAAQQAAEKAVKALNLHRDAISYAGEISAFARSQMA